MSATLTPQSEGCLSVVIPCYNEIATIEECLRLVLLQKEVGQIIVVDDGSTDGTRELLLKFSHPLVSVLFQEKNKGKGAALRRGFADASKPYVLVQDADLEYSPSDYSRLLRPLLDGRADVVYGSRFAGGDARRVLFYWHSLGNKFLTHLSNMFTNLNLTDMETCYKVTKKDIIQSISIEEDRFGFEPEITSKFAKLDIRIFECGISYNGRTYAQGKKIGWRDGLRAVICILKYS